ncbi:MULTISPECIES: type II toxin-antitoxin system VapC family toxin [Methylocaldum]|jgi:predicted nucleic acid-binding protein|uniref:type II toxin-antitoxin system VapC family toxin n=1 Tax=unclassified Methylocaldum TaxID=2622260 RepID=UPI00098A583B|nr:PIN domain nuclease [Methylocaldum sp. 14B]MVF21971.1 PIN domain nuclease [Methylocaldum sp. BRCS4]
MLVDTSVWIDYFNGHASAEADRLSQALADAEPIALPGVVWTEILLGLRTESEAVKISGLLEAFDYVKEPAQSDYIEAARIYRACRAKGYTIRSTIDCVIARLCLRDNLPLLCKDRDFQAISQCFPLRLIAI